MYQLHLLHGVEAALEGLSHLGDGLGAARHADLRLAPHRFRLVTPKLVEVGGGNDNTDVNAGGCITSRAASGMVPGAAEGAPEGEGAVEASTAGTAAGARSVGNASEGLRAGAETALLGRDIAHALLEKPQQASERH
jgi:hypothetical protein